MHSKVLKSPEDFMDQELSIPLHEAEEDREILPVLFFALICKG